MHSDADLKALQDAIYREKVERAREMSALEKFEAGQELFEAGCVQMLGDIRTDMPEAGEGEVAEEVSRRLAIGRRLDRLQLRRTYRG